MKNQQLQIFKIRDLRQKTQFKIDDEYLNGWARYCKPIATAIYNSLSRHAEFHSQKAFPSQRKIAFEHDISIISVRRGLKKLLEYRIITVEQERKNGKFSNYIYCLLDKSVWKKPHHRSKTTYGAPSLKYRARSAMHGKVCTKDYKEERITNTKDYKEKKRSHLIYKKKLKPYYDGLQMRKVQEKWFVLPADGSPWLEFAGTEKDIQWK